MYMKRYWFEFDFSNYENPPYGLIIGCGVTGYEYNDVIQLLKDKVFYGRDLPVIKEVIENVDIQKLDRNHVIPNMDPPINRGIWFPLGYS